MRQSVLVLYALHDQWSFFGIFAGAQNETHVGTVTGQTLLLSLS